MTKTIWLHVVFAEERVSMPGHFKARSLGRQPQVEVNTGFVCTRGCREHRGDRDRVVFKTLACGCDVSG